MKKSKFILLTSLVLLATLVFFSCKRNEPVDTQVDVIYYTVSFNSCGGSEVQPTRVVQNGYATKPSDPTREGYIFDYWSYQGKKWEFGFKPVTSDMTLEAIWIDAKSVYQTEPVTYTAENDCRIVSIKRHFDVMRVPSIVDGLSVVSIGDDVFSGLSSESVSKIIVPDSVTHIGENTFKDCKDIEISIFGKIVSIGESAFEQCNKLSEIALGDGLQNIPPQAFLGCSSLKSVTIPQSVQFIDENAFEDCTALSYVIMHGTLTKIGNGAFIGCTALSKIYYYGSEQEFNNIEIVNGNSVLTSAKLYIYSESSPTSQGNFWHFDANGKIKIW